MLRQELRKLREADMELVKERKKRLEMSRKQKILEKEKAYDDTMRIIKQHERALNKKKE